MKIRSLSFIFLLFFFPLLASGCIGLFGAIFVEPGSTVDLISASPNQVTYEYTHSYDSELPAAGRMAQSECQRFGKHAALQSINRKNIDRSWATFRCD